MTANNRAAAASTLDASPCRATLDAASAGLKLTLARVKTVGLGRGQETCSAYSMHFFETVKARQTAALCKTGPERERDLGQLDSEIDALNAVIARSCGG